MKRRMTVAFGALFFASCFLAFAQSVPIGIDFPFEANEKALEPGTYTFELVNPNTISIVGPGGTGDPDRYHQAGPDGQRFGVQDRVRQDQ